MRRVVLGSIVASLLFGCSSSPSPGTGALTKPNGSTSPSPAAGTPSGETGGGSSGSTGGTALPVAPGTSGSTSGGGFAGGSSTADPSSAGTGTQGAAYPDAGPVTVAPGILTAGIWDDGLNYPFFTQ